MLKDGDEVNKRQEEVLRIIVEDYIKNAHPVSSNAICDLLNCSSATIRNDMSSLESLGLLEKTHTSSGRIPSEKGYRYYVDNIMKPKEMTGEDMLKLQTIFHNQSLVLNDVIVRSMEIISEMTNYTSVILGKASSENKLKQVEVIPINDSNIMAIVITDKGYIEHKMLDVGANVSADEVKKMVELINKLLIGTPINQIGEKLEFEIKPIISKYVAQHEIIYDAFYHAFEEFTNKNTVQMMGKNNIIVQPEFDSVSKIRQIATKFDDNSIVKAVENAGNNIEIHIGKENMFDDDVTIIKTKYNISGEEGTIAIVGPKRMEYDRVVGMLEYIKENLEKNKGDFNE